MTSKALWAFAAAAASAQQVYIPGEWPALPTQCAAYPTAPSEPTYSFTPFSFTQTETTRYASSVTPGPSTTYAPPYSSLSHLVPNLSTTTWGNWYPNATATATDTEDPYGQAAFSAAWERVNVVSFNFTYRGMYSTTVEPTPVPTSELILPPPDYFGPQDCRKFPKGFQFGVSGAAAQIEGAIADEGRTPTLVDLYGTEDKDYVTTENYYLYKQDIVRLASMGVKYYSFSVPWTRIMPFVVEGSPLNQQGLDHYDDLINFVIERGMVPVLTLIHFDTPLQFYGNLLDIGVPPLLGYVDGAYHNETFEDAFVNYGKILMTHFADRVPIWYTFNEPYLYANNGKGVNTVIKSHARLYHFYHEEIKGTGKVSLKLNDNFGVPRDPKNQSDIDAANHFNDIQLGTFGNPIFLGKDYPEAFKMTIPDYVPLSAEDLEYINGTADFLAIDPYSSTVISSPPDGTAACASNRTDPLYPYCVVQSAITTTGWNIGYRSESYVYITPTYLRTYLNYLWNTFRHPVVISEFGFPIYAESTREVVEDQLFDTPRSIYYLSFLSEILKAIWDDGVNVQGVYAWSFVDNWEWGSYTPHFGIQTLNRTTQERRYKKSFFDMADFITARMQD